MLFWGVFARNLASLGVFHLGRETDPELPIVQQFLRATGQRETRGVDFFCDAAIIAQAGVPCLVFGPGDIAQAHTANEWISLTSLRRGTRLLDRFLRSFS